MVGVKKRAAADGAGPSAGKKAKGAAYTHIFADSAASAKRAAAVLPARRHTVHYHRPELLDRSDGVKRLLEWFDSVSLNREMPWRQAWMDPTGPVFSEAALQKRAYEVWISEIMLQQTRVETVKTFFANWMGKWPTIEALAGAPAEDVLAAWRGLGYYSRATRIHQAAQKIVQDPRRKGMLPQLPDELSAEVPGVGPYTAGAVSSIVFGHAVPILDGNVARVLSRQLALYANPKAKMTNDVLWAAADVLVKHAAQSTGNTGRSAVPGLWNQALMELGSTVCTPTKPQCGTCPLVDTCMAHREATQAAGAAVPDIEDLCSLCEPMAFQDDEEDGKAPAKPKPKMRQATLGFGAPKPAPPSAQADKHVQRFPMKLEKQKVRREECLVLVLHDGARFWIQQRPSTGLLASMWQFPALTMSTTEAGDDGATHTVFDADGVDGVAHEYVANTLGLSAGKGTSLGSITHLFSHLHLTMHVHLFTVPSSGADKRAVSTTKAELKNKNFGSARDASHTARWATAADVEAESMGTGMRNVWLAVQQHI